MTGVPSGVDCDEQWTRSLTMTVSTQASSIPPRKLLLTDVGYSKRQR
jgi:hypothetical protein